MVFDRPTLTRRSLLVGLTASVATPVWGNAPTRSPRPPMRPDLPARLAARPLAEVAPVQTPTGSLEALLARAGLTGETALVALDAQTGAEIESHRADLRMPPASTAKAVTAMYALQTLGAEHRFVTRVESRGGAITGGTLTGDLILRGGGDPTLQTADLARLADELVQRGLRRLEGRFIVDDTALPGIEQIDREQPVAAGYNPALGGINLNFNRVYFGWEVQNGRARLALDARSDHEVPGVSVIDIQTAARDLPVYTHDVSADRERWSVAASALNASGSRWLPVRRPGAYAGDVFRALLAARGCRVPVARVGSAPQGAVLAEVRSAPLTSVLREMLRYSTNLTAECVGLSASLAQGAAVQSLARSADRMNGWIAARYDAPGVALVDHSGLGEGSRIAPRVMARYMLAAHREGVLPGLLREHPLAETPGRAGQPVEVRAKTGTLNFVSALTGVAQPRGGRPIVFSIVSADMNRRRGLADDESEVPAGARGWTGRARGLQQALIERWSGIHG